VTGEPHPESEADDALVPGDEESEVKTLLALLTALKVLIFGGGSSSSCMSSSWS
jgi:hypothetical protein